MSQEITEEQAQRGFDDYLENMSMRSRNVLIRIGTEWSDVVGSSGSWVSKSMLMKALEQARPWTANALTYKGRGRNGVVYSLIPLLKDHDMVTVNSSGSHTRYMLTDVGREVIQAMVYACTQCHTTRKCSNCDDGFRTSGQEIIECTHTNREDCEECNGTGTMNNDRTCYRCVENCERCDQHRRLYCYSCRGTQKCNSCKSPTLNRAETDARFA